VLTPTRLRIASPVLSLFLLSPVLADDGRQASPAAHGPDECVKVASQASILHLGSLDSFDITAGGKKAARMLLDCIDKNDPLSARAALATYDQIIPGENFGGEYTALHWLCEYLIALPQEKEAMLADKYVASFYHLLADNNYAALREYLLYKYHLSETLDREKPETIERHRFQEDFILFNNPRREQWEKSSLMIQALGLKRGDVVADVGCGPGYFTFKMADIVGDTGLVFAADNNDRHLEYVSGVIRKYGIRNVRVIQPTIGDVNLPSGAKIDVAYMCSLYHFLYAAASESEREGFLGSIKRHLKPDGRLVIVDNALVEDQTLPYHGPYIAKELVIRQLRYFGFTLAATHQFIPQRYMLVFKLSGNAPASAGPRDVCKLKDCIPIRSSLSLVHFGNIASGPGLTLEGREAAKVFHRALDRHDKDSARAAMGLYQDLIPKERFGDEYTAFLWYCEYILASLGEKQHLLADRFVADYFQALGGEDFTILKTYVRYKYALDASDKELEETRRVLVPRVPPEVSRAKMTAWGELISFNNPNRGTWEKTADVLKFLNLKPGSCVADVGCGPGYYTFKFSDLVGKDGRVYALDTNQESLDYVTAIAAKHGLSNITTITSRLNDTKLPPASADVVFLCSLYHAVYVTSMEYVKDQFIASIKKALKKDGRLVIVDNEILPDDRIPYYGRRIDRRLTILQLEHYGFRLVDTTQFIPQRYILVFERDPHAPSP